jgi:hypothetical protein
MSAARRYRKFTELSETFHNYDSTFKMIGHTPTERPAITVEALQGRIKVLRESRKIATAGELKRCGRIHITKPEAVTPQPSDPPKDLLPEEIIRIMGVKVLIGESETNEPIPIAEYDGCIPSAEACTAAFTRGITSFIPFIYTEPPREEIPDDENNFNDSLCMDNFFNKAAGGLTSTLSGDHLMATIQWNDIMAMALYYKEEINQHRRKQEENEVIKTLASGGSLLSASQRKALEAQQRDSRWLQLLKPILDSRSTEDSTSPNAPVPGPQDSLKPLPPPPQPAPSVGPNPSIFLGNETGQPVPKSITGDKPKRYQVAPSQVFSSGGRERNPQFRSLANRPRKDPSHSFPPFSNRRRR